MDRKDGEKEEWCGGRTERWMDAEQPKERGVNQVGVNKTKEDVENSLSNCLCHEIDLYFKRVCICSPDLVFFPLFCSQPISLAFSLRKKLGPALRGRGK